MRPPPFYDSIFYPYVSPHSRKASLATPRKFLRGVCVFACGCVYASQKYGRSPRSSFLCVAPELSRCSLIFAPRGGRLTPPVCALTGLGHVRIVRSLILALKTTQIASPHCVWVIRWVRFSIVLLHQKSRGLSPRLFAVRNSPPCGGAAARLTAEPVTVTADARGKVPGGFPVRIFVDAPPYGSVCTNTPHFSRLRVCLSIHCSVLAPRVLS